MAEGSCGWLRETEDSRGQLRMAEDGDVEDRWIRARVHPWRLPWSIYLTFYPPGTPGRDLFSTIYFTIACSFPHYTMADYQSLKKVDNILKGREDL